jgi:hypothetical protein
MTWGESNKSDEPLVYKIIVGVLESILVVLTLIVAAGHVLWEIINELIE